MHVEHELRSAITNLHGAENMLHGVGTAGDNQHIRGTLLELTMCLGKVIHHLAKDDEELREGLGQLHSLMKRVENGAHPPT